MGGGRRVSGVGNSHAAPGERQLSGAHTNSGEKTDVSKVSHRPVIPEKLDYFLIYTVGGVWAASFLFFTPATVQVILGHPITIAWTSVAMLGAVLAIVGMLRNDNLLLERLGVKLLLIAPLAFVLVSIALGIVELIQDGTTPRLHQVVLALWPTMILRKRLRELRDHVIIAKDTPLPAELAD